MRAMQLSMSKPQRSPRSAAATNAASPRPLQRSPSRAALAVREVGIGDADKTSQPPSSNGRSMPPISLVAPLRRRGQLQANLRRRVAWTKSTIAARRFRSSFHSPVQPGVMRASRLTQVISVKIKPAPPTAAP